MKSYPKPMRLAARWRVRPLDFDPLRQPVSYALSVAEPLGQWLLARDHVALHGSRIQIVRRVLGMATRRIEVSLNDFHGLVVRMDDALTDICVSINLHHGDPELCLPLFVGTGMDRVGARWQALGRQLGLPLLVLDEEGELRPASPNVGAGAASVALTYPPRQTLASRVRSCAVGRPSYWFSPTFTPESA